MSVFRQSLKFQKPKKKAHPKKHHVLLKLVRMELFEMIINCHEPTRSIMNCFSILYSADQSMWTSLSDLI